MEDIDADIFAYCFKEGVSKELTYVSFIHSGEIQVVLSVLKAVKVNLQIKFLNNI